MGEKASITYLKTTRSNPPAIRKRRPRACLEPGEELALRDLGRFMILSPDLFRLSSGYGRTAAYDSMHDLFEKGLADRGFYRKPRTDEQIALSLPHNSDEIAYKLTLAGFKRGLAEGLVEENTKILAKEWAGAAPIDTYHRLLIVELMIKIRQEIAIKKRLEIGRMTPDFERRGNSSVNRDQVSDDRYIVSDLVVGMEDLAGVLKALFFVEVENTELQPNSSCKTRKTIASKISPYGPYLAGQHRSIKGAEQDVILYVMNRPPDEAEEVISLVPWGDLGELRKLVRFSTFETVREHGVLLGQWLDYQGNEVRLVE